ncbi:MAG TPA: TolC family protein [Bdellovibrionales bacterium]|nr:TolC family protein [Bdellovibrionales bacterium]
MQALAQQMMNNPVSLDIPAEPATGEPLTLNPAQIRQSLLEGNTSVILGANRVHNARIQLSQVRARLLPNLNLGAMLMSAGSFGFGPLSADFLLPFLLPHRWFENIQARHMVDAEKQAYLLLELNQYNSALELYYSYLNDLKARELQLEEVRQYERIESVTAKKYQLGQARKDEYERTRAQTSLSRVYVTRLNEMIIHERAALRHVLGIPLTRGLNVEEVSVPATEKEAQPAQELLAAAFEKAPERSQLVSLMKASKAEKWAKIFGFINVFSLGRSFLNDAPKGFNSLQVQGSLGIGFDYIPNIRLTNNNMEQLRIQERELWHQLGEILERTVHQITVAKVAHKEASTAEAASRSAFDTMLKRYELGLENLTSVVVAGSQLRNAMQERLRTESELNTLRATLARTFMEFEFAHIRGCTLGAFAREKRKRVFILSFFKDIFAGPSKDWISVERMCSAKK